MKDSRGLVVNLSVQHIKTSNDNTEVESKAGSKQSIHKPKQKMLEEDDLLSDSGDSNEF